jgi:hypothetical protein
MICYCARKEAVRRDNNEPHFACQGPTEHSPRKAADKAAGGALTQMNGPTKPDRSIKEKSPPRSPEKYLYHTATA